MSKEAQEVEMGTRPLPEHEWLQQLVGDWKTKSEMTMPDGSACTSEGTESVESLGGLWAYGKGSGPMPDGSPMVYYTALGYDVSFKEYRGFMIMSVSSHHWTYKGELSEDGKTMTLHCEGPHMEKDGETAQYKDVIEVIDADHRKMTSYGQDDEGNWHTFVTVNYTRQ